jgi:hypothetical protein
MLEPDEIGRGMAFLPAYVVLGNRRERVRQFGNAVTPPAAEVIVSALIEAVTGEPLERVACSAMISQASIDPHRGSWPPLRRLHPPTPLAIVGTISSWATPHLGKSRAHPRAAQASKGIGTRRGGRPDPRLEPTRPPLLSHP